MSRWSCIRHGLAGSAALALMQLAAPATHAAEPVDLELILAVDVSLSMSPGELEIQRRGYAAALTHDDVIQAIRDGVHGKIAVTLFEWAGSATQRVVVPWTTIASREDAERVVSQLSARPPSSARRTSISGALAFGGDLFAESTYRGTRRVIDISGDGPNNQGDSVEGVRNALIAKGITINGLPLMTSGGFTSVYDITDLDRYYAQCVIGGPGAFMIAVNDWPQFPEAVRRKLVLELAGDPSDRSLERREAGSFPVVLAQAEQSYDCMVGEKLWRDRSWIVDPQ